LAATGGLVVIPDGYYSITTTTGCQPADNVWISFSSRNAHFLAGANNVIFFSTTNPSGHAYYSQIWNATLDGNGFTGVTGFDLTNFRGGSGLISPRMNNMANGAIFRSGDWSAKIENPYFSAVSAPIQAFVNGASFQIIYPQIDNENFSPTVPCTTGISITNGTSSTAGTLIQGGYAQGCVDGIVDSAIGTRIIDFYGEANSDADIFESAATNPYIIGSTHFGSGARAIKGRNTTGARIETPVMSSGGRSTGLYDWDSTNSFSFEWHTTNSGSMNIPVGTVTGLGAIPSLNTTGGPGTSATWLKPMRFGATCTTAATAGATCTTSYTWTTAMPDTSYTTVCWGVIPTGTPILSLNAIQTAAGIVAQVTAATAAASGFAGIYCMASHD
jgi:hypothetical protein